MSATRILHWVLVLAVILGLILMLKLTFEQGDRSELQLEEQKGSAPATALVRPQKTTTPSTSKPKAGYPFLFPAPIDREYSPRPFLWGHDYVQEGLSKGEIKTPNAPKRKIPEKYVAAEPGRVVFRWVFALP